MSPSIQGHEERRGDSDSESDEISMRLAAEQIAELPISDFSKRLHLLYKDTVINESETSVTVRLAPLYRVRMLVLQKKLTREAIRFHAGGVKVEDDSWMDDFTSSDLLRKYGMFAVSHETKEG